MSPTREILSRDAVITAARQLIVEEGLDAVSLRRLARQLGVTAPALYAYVSDKNDLLRAVTTVEFARLMTRINEADHHEPMERLRQLCRGYVEFAREDPALFRTMFLYPPTVPEATSPETVKNTAGLEMPMATIQEAIDRGELRGDLDPATVVLTLWVTAHGLAHAQLIGVPFDSEHGEALTESVIDTVIHGLSAAPA